MLLLVTSASGANGDGFGALLSFELNGTPRGAFIDDDRIADPRGLRFAPNGLLYCVARDEVVGFDFATGECQGAVARLPRLNGQALVLFPPINSIRCSPSI